MEGKIRPKVIVIGSINIDLVAGVAELPLRGETIHAQSFASHLGGKGGNQAAAAAKLGARAVMVGCVGDDKGGEQIVAGLEAAGVDCTLVSAVSGHPTGTALITVDEKGDNTIVVVPGANAQLTPAHVTAIGEQLAACEALVLQLEVADQVVLQAAKAVAEIRREAEYPWFVFNPSPFRLTGLPPAGTVDLLMVNELEAGEMADMAVKCPNSAARAAKQLLADLRSGGCVVVTLGVQGAVALAAPNGPFNHDRQEDLVLYVPALEVDAVDTTGAGDVFTGGLVAQLAAGRPLEEALRYATAAAALTVMSPGAQSSFPDGAAVAKILPKVKKAQFL